MIPVIGVTCGSGGENGPMSLDMDYTRAISDAGGLPLVIPPDLPGESLAPLLEILDGLLLSGGPDVDPVHFGEEPQPGMGRIDPERDRIELALARLALESGLPILGICRGAQVLNIAGGGDIFQDLPSRAEPVLRHVQPPTPMTYATHSIRVEGGTRLAAITGRHALRVNSWHHQAVRGVAPGFAVSATAEDGVVEAIELAGKPFVMGLQFHPESMAKGGSHVAPLLFEAFVKSCRQPPVS